MKKAQKRVLVLDDDSYRHEVFSKYFVGMVSKLGMALTYEDFLCLLSDGWSGPPPRKQRWDIIMLDHDLGIERPGTRLYDASDPHRPVIREATGLDAARVIADLPPRLRPEKVIIQSLNPVGAERIYQVMLDARIPAVKLPFTDKGLQTWMNQ